MKNQKGIAHLLLLVVFVLIIPLVLFSLVFFGVIKNPFSSIPFLGQKGPSVTLKTEYKNPFDKNTQYVNPFEKYKNPFLVSK